MRVGGKKSKGKLEEGFGEGRKEAREGGGGRSQRSWEAHGIRLSDSGFLLRQR